MPAKGQKIGTRQIVVTYYAQRNSRQIIRQTRSRHEDRAIAATLHHLWTERYPRARFAIVYNEKTGLELARITPTILGFIVTKPARKSNRLT